MSAAKKMTPLFQIGDSVLFLYGPRRVQGRVIEDRGPLGAHGRRILLVQANLDQDEIVTFEVPEDNLEASTQADEEDVTPGTRVEFNVTYMRQGTTNRWRASVKQCRVYQGVKVKGAVAYSTARWEGERQDDEKHAIVSVFVEPIPDMTESTKVAQVRKFADRMFMRHHPDAEIEEYNDTE